MALVECESEHAVNDLVDDVGLAAEEETVGYVAASNAPHLLNYLRGGVPRISWHAKDGGHLVVESLVNRILRPAEPSRDKRDPHNLIQACFDMRQGANLERRNRNIRGGRGSSGSRRGRRRMSPSISGEMSHS